MEAPPFPVLPADLYQRIQLLQGEAKAVLIRELKACWLSCIAVEDAWPGAPTPRPRHDPSGFFPPFVKYGVALFDTFPTIWLEMDPKPSLSDFLALIGVPLQVRIAEEIAPYWPAELADKEAFNVRSSERGTFPVSLWEEYMWASWKRLTKEERAPLEPIAEAIVRALRNGYRDSFADVLMISLAERAEHWTLEGMRNLTATCVEQETRADESPAIALPAHRKAGPLRLWVDARHKEYADLFEAVLKRLYMDTGKMELALGRWLDENPGITLATAQRYRRGSVTSLLRDEKRSEIESAIHRSAQTYGIAGFHEED